MAKNLEEDNTNPLNPQSRYIHSSRPSGANLLNGLPQMLPTRPHSLPMRPTSQQRPIDNYHAESSLHTRTDAIMTAQRGIHAKQPSPAVAATAGSSKGEDHEPNLENLRRINRPPAVISTAPLVARSYPVKRRGDTHQRSGSQKKMEGRGRGVNHFSREDVRSHLIQAPHRYRSSSGRTPIRANGPKQTVASSRNNEESNVNMEIDEIDAFSQNLSAAATKASETKAEEHAKQAHLLKSVPPPSLPRDSVSRSAKYLSSVSNLSDDNQMPIHSFTIPQSQYHPHRAQHSNPSSLIGTPVKRLPAQPTHSEVPAKRKCGSILERMERISGSKAFSSTEMRGAHQSPLHPRSLRPHPGFSAFVPADSNRENIKHTITVHREQDENSDGHDEHPDHEMIDPSQRDRHSLNGTHDHPSEAMSHLQASRTAEAALTPPFPLSLSKWSSPDSTELGMGVMNSSNPIVKQEPVLSRSASPIDVDAPPLSLYDQLGLPNRTSGALRVPRPRFGKDENAKKENWSKEIADGIRWVRGREGTMAPLIIGNVFWRPDGVSFDWKIPPEESVPRAAQEEQPSRPVDSTIVPSHLDQESGRNTPQALTAYLFGINVGQAAAKDTIPPTEAPLPSSRQINSPPIRVKEEAPEISLLPSEPPMLSSSQADARRLCHLENPPRTPHSSGNMIKAEILTPSLPRTPQSPDMSNINTPTLPVAAPSLPTNPAFESPDALSNIATCFLDRYTRCFDHVKSRSKLSEAYTEDAVMSLQFNDLPTEGFCSRVGQPRKQSHAIVNYADRDIGRNLLLDSDRDPKDRQYKWRTKTSLAIGSQSIASRLATFELLSHTPSPSSSRAYQFVVTPIKDLGLLMLEYSGELYGPKANSEERYVSLRFHRTFIMRPNEPDAVSWIDWPWVITNDQMTLFHRPGIVCQCPP